MIIVDICVLLFFIISYYVLNKYSPTTLKYITEDKKNQDPILESVLVGNGLTQGTKEENDIIITNSKKLQKKDVNNKVIMSLSNDYRMIRKYRIWKSLVSKLGRNKALLIMPETYNLLDNNDYNMFQEISKYENNPKFMLKSERDGMNGVYISNNDFSDLFRQVNNYNKFYNRNFSNAFIKKQELDNNRYTLAQRVIDNPYLINGRSFKIRTYLLILKNQGKIKGYLYRNGTIYYPRDKWNSSNIDIYNTIASKEMMNYKRTPSEVNRVYHEYPKTIQALKKNISSSDKLFDNIVEISKLICYVSNYNMGNLISSMNNESFELFNLDFTVDENLKPWLLKMNKAKKIENPSDTEYKIRYNCWNDVIRIINLVPYNEKNGFSLVWE